MATKKKAGTKKKAAPKKTAKKAAPKKTAKKATKKTAKKAATKKAASKKTAKKAAPKKTVKKASAKAPAKATKKTAKAPSSAPKATTKKPSAPAQTQSSPAEHPLVGTELPEFTLVGQSGETTSTRQLASSADRVVLYFYPKDDTPGCTAQACGFRDSLNRLESSGIKVYGVSPDDSESHRKFTEKYGLNFPILTDTDHKLAEALNVWKEKNFMGRTYMGIDRSTFLLHNGRVIKAWQPVKVEGHVDEVLSTAEKL